MSRKTPKYILGLMEYQQGVMSHVTEILRVKNDVPIENQTSYIREKSEDYWVGLADGANAMLEEALRRANCYAGFQNQAEKPVVLESGDSFIPWTRPDSPDYAGWRRQYLTRG